MARNKYPEVTINRITDAALKLFLQKGYDATTIQDIINELGDLSKGAIYYHFKSKEDIITAVINNLFAVRNEELLKVFHSNGTGLEKIKRLFTDSMNDPAQEMLIYAAPNLMKNPRFLAEEVFMSVTELAPLAERCIKEGIADGSITCNYPKEFSEVLLLLSNIWISPYTFVCTQQEMYGKFYFFKEMTDKLGVPIFDDSFLARIEQLREIITTQQNLEKNMPQ